MPPNFAPARHFTSPAKGYEDAPPLPMEISEDGKSYVNVDEGKLSDSYGQFPVQYNREGRGGFDAHIYYFQNNPKQAEYAKELWERIRREFPELRIYKLWDKPVGPHPVAMFEVNIFTPAQFGAFVPWLNVWRGPLSALVHPNTVVPEGVNVFESAIEDHTTRAMWLGERIALDIGMFRGGF